MSPSLGSRYCYRVASIADTARLRDAGPRRGRPCQTQKWPSGRGGGSRISHAHSKKRPPTAIRHHGRVARPVRVVRARRRMSAGSLALGERHTAVSDQRGPAHQRRAPWSWRRLRWCSLASGLGACGVCEGRARHCIPPDIPVRPCLRVPRVPDHRPADASRWTTDDRRTTARHGIRPPASDGPRHDCSRAGNALASRLAGPSSLPSQH